MKIFKITFLLILGAFSNIYTQDFWEKTTGLETVKIYSLAINSSGDIFAGTDSNGVFRSTDNGSSWTNLGIMNYDIYSIAINSNDDIFVATYLWGGIYRSTDNGNNWDSLGLTLFDKSIAINNINGYIFVGTGALGCWRTTDNGDTWEEINNGMTASYVSSFIINSSGHIFAGTYFNSSIAGSGGVYRSSDNGGNWVQINTGLSNLDILSLAINSSGHIFAGTTVGGAFRSTDNGNNWVEINQGLTSEGLWVRSLAINSNGDIFAGGDGVFRSSDNGANWVQINQGLTNPYTHSLSINSNGDVFAGTEGGIFRSIPSANIKVFLQGPYVSGSMSTTLNASGYIPEDQPYNTAPWNYNGGEAVTSIPAGVVDWVLLELRSDFTTQVSRRAAFLLSDGSVVDLDGVSSVKFPTVTPGDYYVVIRHRNHLAVMTADKVTLSGLPTLYDMSSDLLKAYGTNAMKDLGGGAFGLYTGDGNRDGFVTSTDFNIFNPKFTSAASGYEYSDWNLDGLVTSTDFNFFNPNFTTAKQTFVP